MKGPLKRSTIISNLNNPLIRQNINGKVFGKVFDKEFGKEFGKVFGSEAWF